MESLIVETQSSPKDVPQVTSVQSSVESTLTGRDAATKRHPRSLQMLSLEAVLSHLSALCQSRNYGDNKRGLKHYLKFQLPSMLRQQLLDLALRDRRIYTLIDLNLFELLLSPTVKRVNVHNVRPFFRLSFAEMLQQLGTGLELLVLEDNSWLQSRDVLPLTLSRMPHLQYISLRYLANDAILASLSRHCVRLQEIDVSGSIDVTDQGMQVLCQPATPVDCEDSMSVPTCRCHPADAKKKRDRKISAPARIGGTGGVIQWLPRLVKGIRRHSVSAKKPAVHYIQPPLDEESAAALWPEDEEFISKVQSECQTPNSCIRSLRKLSVSGTQVTSDGINLVLQSSPSVFIVT